MMMKIMTFLTDFGTKNAYVAQMKAIALSLSHARLIDITHEVTPYNIREGAFLLQTAAPRFPVGTVHIAVVDPGVGTSRKGIVITTNRQVLVGPDNGLLLPAARALGSFTVYEITNPKYMISPISSTFHARDIFTPIAAHIVEGVSFEDVGPQIDDFVDLDFVHAICNDKGIVGTVLYIDSFGNIITNITESQIHRLKHGSMVTVFIGSKKHNIPFAKSYEFVKPQKPLVTIGSSRLVELSMNRGNAAQQLKVKPGYTVHLQLD